MTTTARQTPACGFREAAGLVGAALGARPAPSGLEDELALARSLEADLAQTTPPSSVALAHVVDAFALDPVDALLLALATLAELDLRAAIVLGALDGRTTHTGLSVATAVEVLSPVVGDRAVQERLSPAGALVASGLLEVAATDPWPQSDVRVADRVVGLLLHARSLDPLVGP